MKCLSDFGELRLCRRGEMFMRSPNRRWPRSVELLSGRRYDDYDSAAVKSSSPYANPPFVILNAMIFISLLIFRQVEDTFIVLLKGIHDRDAASTLKGHMLYARTAESRQSLEDGEFLVADLVGLGVYMDKEKEQYIGMCVVGSK